MNQLVSIIIPVFNGANFLSSAIESALSQDYNLKEVIVINDGSTDSTEEIAKKYHNDIIYIHKENGGVASALNAGIERASGDYISWLSHDDIYKQNKISAQMEIINKLGDIIVFSDFEQLLYPSIQTIHSSLQRTLSGDVLCSRQQILKLLFMSEIHGCTLLVPRSCFSEIGMFDPSLKTTQDYALWYLFVKKQIPFYYLDKVLITSRIHKDQGSKKLHDFHITEVKELNKFFVTLFKIEILRLPPNERSFYIDEMNKRWGMEPGLSFVDPPRISLFKRLHKLLKLARALWKI